MNALAQELRSGLRRLRRHAAFSSLAVATLAVGLGSALFLWSLYEQVVLRELPVAAPRQLVLAPLMTISPAGEAHPFGRFALAEYEELRAATLSAVDLIAYAPATAAVRFDEGGTARPVASEWISENYFEVLGVTPALGRAFAASDDPRRGGAPAVVLGHGAWIRRFAADPAAVGKVLLVDGRPATVIGVAPKRFRSLRVGAAPELYRLASAAPDGAATLRLAGRLAPGATAAQAEAKLRAARAASPRKQQSFLVVDGKTSRAEERLDVVPGARGESGLRGPFARSVVLVGAMLALVLVVLAANLANLLAARAADERRPMAIRAALGASKRRLVLGWWAESLVLAAAGGAGGLVLALGAGPALLARLPVPDLDRAFDIRFDLPLALAALAITLGTALLVGALSAREAARTELLGALRGESAQATEERGRARWRLGLIAGQAALSVLLLCGTSLLVRTLGELLAIDTGLPLAEVVSFGVEFPQEGPARPPGALADLAAALEALPGVEQVSYAGEPVLAGSSYYGLAAIEGYEPAADETVMLNLVPVSPGFFSTLELPIVAGRALEPRDLATPHRAVVVNRRFVERYFAQSDALGRHLSFDPGRRSFATPAPGDLEIVGVVADAIVGDVREPPQPRAYPAIDDDSSAVSFLVRTRVPPAGRAAGRPPELAAAIGALLRERAPGAALGELRTLAGRRDELLARERFLSRLAQAFGALTLLLTGLGLYGTIAYAATRRGREIALRVALGARPRQIVARVSRDAALAAGAGALAGAALALPATRLLAGFLYGVEPGDPAALATATALLAAAAVVAAWLPAQRAARLDPAALLKSD